MTYNYPNEAEEMNEDKMHDNLRQKKYAERDRRLFGSKKRSACLDKKGEGKSQKKPEEREKEREMNSL